VPVKDTVPATVETAPAKFKVRSNMEQRAILYELFNSGMDLEDMKYFKLCYEKMLNNDDAVSVLLQCSSNSISVFQCSSNSISVLQCSSNSISVLQCSSNSISVLQCSSNSISVLQCSSNSI